MLPVSFDYSDKLNALGVNPRAKSEILYLLVSRVGSVPTDKDGSGGVISKHLYQKKGVFTRDVHLLCPPHVAYQAFLAGNSYFVEWLIVSVKGDIYIIVLHTDRNGTTGVCTSTVDEISKKNPTVQYKDRPPMKIKAFVKWWLKECKMEPKPEQPQAEPINPAEDGQRLPNASASTFDVNPDGANFVGGGLPDDDGDPLYANARNVA
jgi:hypothetical protein